MSEATVKALTAIIYDALIDSRKLEELDNEQVYEAARVAAQTIEAAGTTKAIIRAWLEEAVYPAEVFEVAAAILYDEGYPVQGNFMDVFAEAIREVFS
jgi:hypothetical protein